MKKQAKLIVKRRSTPKRVVIVAYDAETGRDGKVLAAEPIVENFSNDDLVAAARRLVPQVPEYAVIRMRPANTGWPGREPSRG